jgi:hypothetical protein
LADSTFCFAWGVLTGFGSTAAFFFCGREVPVSFEAGFAVTFFAAGRADAADGEAFPGETFRDSGAATFLTVSFCLLGNGAGATGAGAGFVEDGIGFDAMVPDLAGVLDAASDGIEDFSAGD